MDKEPPFETELYTVANSVWPASGKHILATSGNGNLVVFQAYKASIAEWASKNGTFKGCPGFSMERMTWIKPNFLWMMYRSGWANKKDQEHILAIHVKECGFKKMLELCKRRGGDGTAASETTKEFGEDDVRIQWDPDHDPFGEKVERRAIQLGIRGRALQKYVEDWILSITDITDFVKAQYVHVQSNQLDLLHVPVQRIYDVSDEDVRKRIHLDSVPI